MFVLTENTVYNKISNISTGLLEIFKHGTYIWGMLIFGGHFVSISLKSTTTLMKYLFYGQRQAFFKLESPTLL